MRKGWGIALTAQAKRGSGGAPCAVKRPGVPWCAIIEGDALRDVMEKHG